MVRQEHHVNQLKILMYDLDDGLTAGVDRVSKDPLNTAEHGVDDEVGLESLLASNSSTGYHREEILPGHVFSVGGLIHLWTRVEMEPCSQLLESDSVRGTSESELDVPATLFILHQSKRREKLNYGRVMCWAAILDGPKWCSETDPVRKPKELLADSYPV
jgi:hypothetical protein